MIPVVTPVQMAAVDAAAPEPAGVLIARAGAAVARAAEDLLGGRYGRRVTVIVGKGNNGADGRAAAGRLRSAGVRVGVIDAAEAPEVLAPADLYVDAAFGTGLSRPWSAPGRACPDAPVLAVDIPSGLHGLYGSVLGGPVWPADRTVTFAALKPGLLLGSGPRLCGEVVVADIGLNVDALWRDAPSCRLIGDEDVETLPAGSGSTHKWQNAVLVVAGSPGMGGAAALVCAAAFRSGARMVHLSAPDGVAAAVEAVRSPPPLRVPAHRFKAVAVGPGLGTDREALSRMSDALNLDLPAVIDADGLRMLARPELAETLRRRRRLSIPTVLTPHEGELQALDGSLQPSSRDGSSEVREGGDRAADGREYDRPGPLRDRGEAVPGPLRDRIAEARVLARRAHAVVLLKGGPTVVADPDGRTLIAAAGDSRLATAGTGDVLTGMIAGRLAAFSGRRSPAEVLTLVAEAAHLHGRAASSVLGSRLTAGDLIDAVRVVTP